MELKEKYYTIAALVFFGAILIAAGLFIGDMLEVDPQQEELVQLASTSFFLIGILFLGIGILWGIWLFVQEAQETRVTSVSTSESDKKTRILIELIGGLLFVFLAINMFFSHQFLISALAFVGQDIAILFLNYIAMFLIGGILILVGIYEAIT